jgi:cysteine-rich repeat protein
MAFLLAAADAGRAADHLQAGAKLAMKSTASSAKLVFLSKAPPVDLGSGDPTADGGTLRVLNPSSGESATLALPASGWKVNGAGTIYKYLNKLAPGGPSAVKVAVVKNGGALKISAKGTGITLDEPAQGSLAVVFEVGPERYCARFDGPLGGGVVATDEAGQFSAKNAPPPAMCPATTTTSTSTSTTITGTTTATTATETTTTETTVSTTTTTLAAVCGNGDLDAGEECDDGNLVPEDGCDASCLEEDVVSNPVPPGGTLTTDTENDGATASDPVESAVTSPVSGGITIVETSLTTSPPAGFDPLGQAVEITAPAASAADPLALQFTLDASLIPPGGDQTTIVLFRDGVALAACVGGSDVAFPDPCVSARVLLGDGDVRLTALSSHASTWTFGSPACGNGTVDPGEPCDPLAPSSCGAGASCKTDCTCAAVCDCCTAAPEAFTVTTSVAAGICGAVQHADETLFRNLDCGGLYIGGGNNGLALPISLGNDVTFKMTVASCDPATERLTLAAATADETADNRTCTAEGCLFGPPFPVPNGGLSACVVARLAQDASGTSSCTGDTTLVLPLTGDIYLEGDAVPAVPGIQPCPVCTLGTCQGGPNEGQPCVAVGALGTSHDCPPDPGTFLSTFSLGTTATTGAARAVGAAIGAQQEVFCGFCRNPSTPTWQNPPQPCTSAADCTTSPFTACGQRSSGAFGPGGTTAHRISLDGSAPGCLADGAPHAATVVGGMCMAPTYVSVVDQFVDLPGPGAMSVQGTIALESSLAPPCCAARRMTMTSGAGLLQVATLTPFPFPSGVQLALDSAAGDGDCRHAAGVPAGGFSVPVFCIPALGFTVSMDALGCATGSGDGAGAVWDGDAACADADIRRVGDTSDPDGSSCATLGAGCSTSAGGAAFDNAGNVDTTRGDAVCDAPGLQARAELPTRFTVWNDAASECPDGDGQFDPGSDVLVLQFDTILAPTTASADADFTDLNGDACSFAGSGPDHTKHCAADASRPCTSDIQCGQCSVTTAQACFSPGLSGCPAGESCVGTPCVDGPLVGSPPAGPCCVAGQTTKLVAAGLAFTGGAPLYDTTYSVSMPATVTACGAAAAPSCTVTTNVCAQ